jgi:hypothetical protein
MLFVSVALSSCFGFGRKVEGNGNRQTRDYSISNFTEVSLAGSMTVYITQGSTYSVKVEADENLFEYLKIEKDGNELEIGSRNNYNLRSKGGIKVFVTSPTYEGAEVAGSGKIISQSKITNARVINIDVAGSGDVQLDLDAPEVHAEVAGSGNVLLKGTTRELQIDIAGSGDIKAFDLMAEVTKIDIAGSGNAQVSASRELDVDIAGSGDVTYKGNPAVKTSKAGSGEVRKAG